LLINEEAALFAQDAEQQEAAPLSFTQQELKQESHASGVEINFSALPSAMTEESQFLHFA